jgi:bifunctional polynucleotide phosphatase/kinase
MDFEKKDTCYYFLCDNDYKKKKYKKVKLALFDWDGTIVPFKKNDSNKDLCEPLYDEIPTILKKLLKNNYHIVILSNQYGIKKGKITIEEFVNNLNKFLKKFKLENKISVMIATDKDVYRKPLTGMLELYLKLTNYKINWDKTFYVGDAGGRKGDFSNSDYLLTHNINVLWDVNIKFMTPEKWLGYSDEDIIEDNKKFDSKDIKIEKEYPEIIPKKTCIIMVGPPGSGKSTYSKYYEKTGYIRICQDQLKTKNKVIKKIEENCKEGNSMIIDRLNPKIEDREEWIQKINNIDDKYNFQIVYIDIPKCVSKHIVKVRQHKEGLSALEIPEIVINTFYKRLQIPDRSKDNVYIVGLPPIDNETDFKKYLLECRY